MTLTIEYESPSGTTIEFAYASDAEYFILDAVGLLSTRITQYTVRSPAQLGDRLVDVIASGRTIALSIWITGSDEDATWQLREDLAGALFIAPSSEGEQPELGTLTVFRNGLATRTIPVIPIDSPQESIKGENVVFADLEFFAPYPYWSSPAADDEANVITGGFVFPIEFPIEFDYTRIEATINNMGNIPASVTIRLDGEIDTPTVTNVTTGRSIQINRTISDGEYVIIETAYGRKTITLYPGETNILGDIDLDVSDFFTLAPGNNEIVVSALGFGENAEATVTWTENWTGI